MLDASLCVSKTLGSNVILNGLVSGNSVEILIISSILLFYYSNVSMKFRHPENTMF